MRKTIILRVGLVVLALAWFVPIPAFIWRESPPVTAECFDKDLPWLEDGILDLAAIWNEEEPSEGVNAFPVLLSLCAPPDSRDEPFLWIDENTQQSRFDAENAQWDLWRKRYPQTEPQLALQTFFEWAKEQQSLPGEWPDRDLPACDLQIGDIDLTGLFLATTPLDDALCEEQERIEQSSWRASEHPAASAWIESQREVLQRLYQIHNYDYYFVPLANLPESCFGDPLQGQGSMCVLLRNAHTLMTCDLNAAMGEEDYSRAVDIWFSMLRWSTLVQASDRVLFQDMHSSALIWGLQQTWLRMLTQIPAQHSVFERVVAAGSELEQLGTVDQDKWIRARITYEQYLTASIRGDISEYDYAMPYAQQRIIRELRDVEMILGGRQGISELAPPSIAYQLIHPPLWREIVIWNRVLDAAASQIVQGFCYATNHLRSKQFNCRLAPVAIALQSYYHKHGRYPETLEKISQVAQVRYRVLDDGSAWMLEHCTDFKPELGSSPFFLKHPQFDEKERALEKIKYESQNVDVAGE